MRQRMGLFVHGSGGFRFNSRTMSPPLGRERSEGRTTRPPSSAAPTTLSMAWRSIQPAAPVYPFQIIRPGS